MCASRHVLDEIGNTNAQLDRTELVAVFPPVLVFEHPSLNVHDKAFERCELRSLKTYNVVVAKSAIQSQRVYDGKLFPKYVPWRIEYPKETISSLLELHRNPGALAEPQIGAMSHSKRRS